MKAQSTPMNIFRRQKGMKMYKVMDEKKKEKSGHTFILKLILIYGHQCMGKHALKLKY